MSKKIAFIGAPSSGKSTISSYIFSELKKAGINIEYIQEWVRQDIFRNGPMKSIWEQFRTYQHQKEMEDSVPNKVDSIIIDSSTLMPYFYACLYADHADARQRLVLQDMYKYLLDDLYLKRYDMIFYLPIINPLIKDGVRFQTDKEIEILDEHMNLVFSKLYKPGNVYKIDGPIEERFEKIMPILSKIL